MRIWTATSHSNLRSHKKPAKKKKSHNVTAFPQLNSSWLHALATRGHEVRLRSASSRRDGVGMKSEVRCTLFSPDSLTFIRGVYPRRRNKRRNPTNKKDGREQNLCHECHLCRCFPCFSPLFLSMLFTEVLLSLSLSLPFSLPLSPPVEYGFEADSGKETPRAHHSQEAGLLRAL